MYWDLSERSPSKSPEDSSAMLVEEDLDGGTFVFGVLAEIGTSGYLDTPGVEKGPFGPNIPPGP